MSDTDAAELEAAVESVVAQWSKLSDRQLDRIAALLRAGQRTTRRTA